MVGTWQSLQNQPNFNADTMLLLTDGTVMCHELNTNRWYKLTPDGNGNYVRGTWSQLQSMTDNSVIPTSRGGPTYAPLYFASAVLRDGTVFVAGGEYNGGIGNADLLATEIYDPVSNSWMIINPPANWTQIGDAPSCVLPDGRVLLGSINSSNTAIYDPFRQVWTAAANKGDSSSEETFTLLPDNTILTVQCSNIPNAEKYLIDKNQWVGVGSTPSTLPESCPGFVAEIGPAILLPDGRVFAIGATGNTALYTRSANESDQGSWKSGPTLTDNQGNTQFPMDAPAVLLPNGKVLCVGGPSPACQYPAPTTFFEYDPGANTATRIPSPVNANGPPYEGRLLLLPSGQVLFSNNTNNIQVYTPDGQPNAAWKPAISTYPSIMIQGYTYVITGTQFNGLSQACSYGDDAQMATNYPIVRLTNAITQIVHFLRTFNHSTMGVATGTTQHSTNVVVLQGIQAGQWNMALIANGIASDPVTITIPAPDLWIKFLYINLLIRIPSQTEINYWANYMNQGASYALVADDFLYSLEYCKDTVTSLYSKLLDRTPDPGGLSNWINFLQQQRRSIQDAIVGFCDSPEYKQEHPVPTQFVESLYNKLLVSDPAGLKGWVDSLNSGKNTTAEVIIGFLRSEEYALQRATECYAKYLGRNPDPTGLQFWAQKLQTGLSLQDLTKGFVTSEEYIERCQHRS